MPVDRSPRRLTSIPAAAAEFGVHDRTIRRYISAGRITGYRFGPRILRVDLDELDALLRPLPTTGGAA